MRGQMRVAAARVPPARDRTAAPEPAREPAVVAGAGRGGCPRPRSAPHWRMNHAEGEGMATGGRAVTVRRALLKVVVALCLVLGAVAGLVVWRLNRGPVSLAAVQPALQSLLHRGFPFVTRFAEPTLVWSREDGTLALGVKDLDIRTPGGDFVAGAPSALVEVAAWPLLAGRRIEPVRVTLTLPELELTHTTGGELV